jgi:hypothetical protein
MTKNKHIGLVFAKTGSINSGTEHRAGGGGLDPRTAIEGSFSAWGGLGKLDRRLGRGETFFPDSNSDRDSDETFQISRNLGLEHVEFIFLNVGPDTYHFIFASVCPVYAGNDF